MNDKEKCANQRQVNRDCDINQKFQGQRQFVQRQIVSKTRFSKENDKLSNEKWFKYKMIQRERQIVQRKGVKRPTAN